MHWLWVLIVGAVIGAIAGAITNRGAAMGWISNIIAGLVGSSIGEAILGSWGAKYSWYGHYSVNYRRNSCCSSSFFLFKS